MRAVLTDGPDRPLPQSAVRFQFAAAPDFESLQNHYYPFAKIAIQYVRPKEVQYVQDLLGPLVGRIVADLNLNLDTDAVKVGSCPWCGCDSAL